MQLRRYLWLTLLLLGGALAGCAGGSGSSGFDAFPSESAAITQALTEQRCVQQATMTICPADTAALAQAPGRVDTGAVGPIECSPQGAGAICHFTLPFAPQGFAPGATFRVAVRQADASSPWTIGGELALDGAPDVDATVMVAAPQASLPAGVAVQLAILVFTAPSALEPNAEVDRLAQTGATFAFVTTKLTVHPAPPPP